LLPFKRAEFRPLVEQLACRYWRQRRAYADLAEHGVIRDGKPAPVLGDLAKLENRIATICPSWGATGPARARTRT
jgi:hypothetical protein